MTEKKISLPIVGGDTVPVSAPKTRAEGGDIMSEIEREVTDNTVVLYMKGTPQQPMCGFSARAAGILDTYGITYHSVNILADPEKRQAIKTYSAGDSSTAKRCLNPQPPFLRRGNSTRCRSSVGWVAKSPWLSLRCTPTSRSNKPTRSSKTFNGRALPRPG